MLHRHHYVQGPIVAADEDDDDVQKVNDGPSRKRRRLAEQLDGLLEPKVPHIDERLSFDVVSQQQPVAGTSRAPAVRSRRSPSLRRHNSLPTSSNSRQFAEGVAAAVSGQLASHNGAAVYHMSATSPVIVAHHQPTASLHHVVDTQPSPLPPSVLTPTLLGPVMSSRGHINSGVAPHQSPFSTSPLTVPPPPYHSLSHHVTLSQPTTSTTFYGLPPPPPPPPAAHSGCSVTCSSSHASRPSTYSASNNVTNTASSSTSRRRSAMTASTSSQFPPFSAVGVVPAPVLAADVLPNYYGFLHSLSMIPTNVGIYQSVLGDQDRHTRRVPSAAHQTRSTVPHPPAVHQHTIAMPPTLPSAPLIASPDVDYILPSALASLPSLPPYHHQPTTSFNIPSTVSRDLPPYPPLVSGPSAPGPLHSHHMSPYNPLFPMTSVPVPDFRRRSEGSSSWTGVSTSGAPLVNAPSVSISQPAHSSSSQPLFVQHFLAMLENTLGAIHESTQNSHGFPPQNFHNYEALLGLARQLSENKPKGMSKCDIDRLVTYQYNADCGVKRSDVEQSSTSPATTTGSSSGATDATSQTSCVVCMCDFVQRQRVRELPCQHIFHAKCIDKWLKTNRTCPLCRADALDLLNCDEKISSISATVD